MMRFFLFAVGAFLVGGFPTAYLAGRLIKGVDIRRHGSGNVGATNAFRVLGKGPGSIVFAIDFFKGFFPVFVYQQLEPSTPDVFLRLGVGVAAIFGHVFSPYLGFKGGKGVATGAGVLCIVFPMVFAGSLLVWITCFLATKIVSISSLAAALSLIVFAVGFKSTLKEICFFIAVAIFVVWTHRSNIQRLVKGEEKTRK